VSDAYTIRIMDATPEYPAGYLRYYDEYGDPVDFNGKPGTPETTHFDLDGPLPDVWGFFATR
jgi:hypothetical protein